jgi:hypothetical protein
MEGEYGWRPTATHHNGTCRRHAPIAVHDNRMGTPNVAMWPYVKGDDGCGDFESRIVHAICPIRGDTP